MPAQPHRREEDKEGLSSSHLFALIWKDLEVFSNFVFLSFPSLIHSTDIFSPQITYKAL